MEVRSATSSPKLVRRKMNVQAEYEKMKKDNGKERLNLVVVGGFTLPTPLNVNTSLTISSCF